MLCPLCDFLYIIQTLSHDLSDEPKKTRKELSYNIFFKRDGNSRNTITFAGKNLCHFALSLFFSPFQVRFLTAKVYI